MTKSNDASNSILIVAGVFVVMILLAARMNGDEGKDLLETRSVVSRLGSSASITEGAVRMPPRGSEAGYDLPYLHCGPEYTSDAGSKEMIMLHGAAFKKENWRDSGILGALCSRSNKLSVTALDLDVKVDGEMLGDAFRALKEKGTTSGEPAVFVTPSASGKSMIELGLMAAMGAGDRSKLLVNMVHSWIPVACPMVRRAQENALEAFKNADIPILAVHGTKDRMGIDTSDRLMKLAGARELPIEGGHPCYLDSPKTFVQATLNFIGE